MTYNFNFRDVFNNIDLLLVGMGYTLQLSFITMVLGLAIGITMALVRTWGPTPLRWLAASYVEVIRNTPLLVQLFIIFFGLPSLGLRLSAEQAAVIALSVNLGAYATEIVRAGIEAIHRSQVEAGLSLGMSRLQVFRYVVLFPALRVIYPALASQFILLMLATSIVSLIAAEDLFHMAAFLESRTFRSFEIYLVVTGLYLVMALLFRAMFAVVYRVAFERR
ncbi:MAG: amino acid ABC transporter permease [Geminicoccaceae bacterium]